MSAGRRKERRLLTLLASNAALRFAALGGGQVDARRFEDGAITSEVETALQSERSLNVPELVVATEDRVVRLRGAVCSQAQIDRATRIARAIAGVLSVQNELSLMPH